MTSYEGPDRRAESTVAGALVSLAQEVRRVARLIEGENGGAHINRGVLGEIADLAHTDAKLDISVQDLDGRVRRLETRWQNLKWALVGYAAGGGVVGGGLVAAILKVVGS